MVGPFKPHLTTVQLFSQALHQLVAKGPFLEEPLLLQPGAVVLVQQLEALPARFSWMLRKLSFLPWKACLAELAISLSISRLSGDQRIHGEFRPVCLDQGTNAVSRPKEFSTDPTST